LETRADIAAFLQRPRGLRLFLSVDVSGSTAYKTRRQNLENFHEHWARFYEAFFEDFPQLFQSSREKAAQEAKRALVEPQFWKCLGDELIYTARVSDGAELYALVSAFYRTAFEYDKEVSKKWGLRLKATGWTAGFPLRNSAIPSRATDGAQSVGGQEFVDFIGPDIDIGFRITRASRPGRMVVSMDLAELLAQNTEPDSFSFYHVGWEVFRGVFNDHPYPIIWICEKERPAILPWEDFTCSFTKNFKEGRAIGAKELRELLKEIRAAHPDLKLFVPYFDEKDMPDFQRQLLIKWKEEAEKQPSLDLGEAAEMKRPASSKKKPSERVAKKKPKRT